MRELKLSEAQIDEMLGEDDDEQDEDDAFLVWPENWDCAMVFLSLGSRWKVDGLSGRYDGIERADIESTLRLMGIEPGRHRQIYEEFQIMERAALEVLNRERH